MQHNPSYFSHEEASFRPAWADEVKDVFMYLEQLSREAKLIVQGRQEFVTEFERFLARCKAWLFG